MVISVNEVELRKSKVGDFIDAVEFLMQSAKVRNGCLHSGVYCNGKDNSKVVVYHEWENMALFKDYLQSDLFKQVLSLFEMSLKKPVHKIYECNSVKDLPWIENVILKNALEGA